MVHFFSREKSGAKGIVWYVVWFSMEILHLKHVGNREKNTGSGKDHRSLGPLGTAGLVDTVGVVDNRLDGGRSGSGSNRRGSGPNGGLSASRREDNSTAGGGGDGGNRSDRSGGGDHWGVDGRVDGRVNGRVNRVNGRVNRVDGRDRTSGSRLEGTSTRGDRDANRVALIQVQAVGTKLQVPLEQVVEGGAPTGGEGSAAVRVGGADDDGFGALFDGDRDDGHGLGGGQGEDGDRRCDLHG